MKQILRMFAVVGVVLLTALISAGACDKKDDANNNGGAGTATISVTDVKTTVAKLSDGTNIKLKASAFPNNVASGAAVFDVGLRTIVATAANNAEAFSLQVVDATGGLVVLVDKSVTSADKLSVTADGFLYTSKDDAKKGAFVDGSAGSDTKADTTKKGMKIYSALVDAATYFPASNNTQPVIGCVATASEVPQFEVPNVVTTADGLGDLTKEDTRTTVKEVDVAKALLESTLKGGQKAVCSVASIGNDPIAGTAGAAWLTTNKDKKSIEVYAIGVKTDGLKLSEIIHGADAAKDLAILAGGFTTDEMKEILKNSKLAAGAKKLVISVVSDTDF